MHLSAPNFYIHPCERYLSCALASGLHSFQPLFFVHIYSVIVNMLHLLLYTFSYTNYSLYYDYQYYVLLKVILYITINV